MMLPSLIAAVVGFPAPTSCYPATAAWDYAHFTC